GTPGARRPHLDAPHRRPARDRRGESRAEHLSGSTEQVTSYRHGSHAARDREPKDWSPELPRPEYVFDTKHDRYALAVHVFLLDRHGRVLLMRRAGSGYADGQLGLPAGHVDLGETPIECAVREVAEEVGIILDPGRLR